MSPYFTKREKKKDIYIYFEWEDIAEEYLEYCKGEDDEMRNEEDYYEEYLDE